MRLGFELPKNDACSHPVHIVTAPMWSSAADHRSAHMSICRDRGFQLCLGFAVALAGAIVPSVLFAQSPGDIAFTQLNHRESSAVASWQGEAQIAPIGPHENRTLEISLRASTLPAHDKKPTGQLCWSFGTVDATVYFGEIEGRPDRRDSFESLLDITGIEHLAVHCVTQDIATHRASHMTLLDEWSRLGLEIVDTTFLSDLDY